MRRALISLALAALAACSPEPADRRETAAPAAPGLAEVNAQPVIAPTGSAQLTPLAPSAVAAVGGEDGCTFAYQERLLLVAGGDAGAAVVGGTEVRLKAQSGVDAAPVFKGGGYTLTVRETGAASSDLIVSGPGGETVFSPGTWACAS